MRTLPRWFATLLALTLLQSTGFAIDNPDEASRAPTHATLLGGPGNDSISAYSGDLKISIPIGSTWELPGKSWSLSLNYSSKVWRLWREHDNDLPIGRKGPFGVGWGLTMGRVFQMCRYGCGPMQKLFSEDSRGIRHQATVNTQILLAFFNLLSGLDVKALEEIKDSQSKLVRASFVYDALNYLGDGFTLMGSPLRGSLSWGNSGDLQYVSGRENEKINAIAADQFNPRAHPGRQRRIVMIDE